MFAVDDLVEGAAGAVVAGGVLVAAGAGIAFASPRARPVFKRVIAGYLTVKEQARSTVAEAVERAQDLYAEAKYEHQSQLAGDHIEVVEASAPVRRSRPSANEQPA
jgi:hypothetical protein